MYDVIVIGAGPGGSTTAKKCAELGLKTIILEKKTLPRDKLCSGMIMGRMANELVQQEFGDIPDSVLTTPRYLKGFLVYAPGVEPVVVEQRMPYAWRRDLDFWMLQKAEKAGAELRAKAIVTSVEQKGERCLVRLEGETLEARFVVGADGAGSGVRKQLFPEVPVVTRTAYSEIYHSGLTLDRNYFHWMFPIARPRPRFDVNYKGEFLIFEGGVRDLRKEIPSFLRPFGYSPEMKPIKRDGCISGARLAQGHLSGPLPVARGNILLVGDAAMLQIPATGEGINTAIKSGITAAQAITEATAAGGSTAEIYSSNMEPVFSALRGLLTYEKKMEEAAKQGALAIARAFADALRASFAIT